MPGSPCLRCCGLVTEERLTHEAQAYGAAGGRPQVVWSNGVLASTVVGLLAQIITPWHPRLSEFVYLEYDGNKGTLHSSVRMKLLQGKLCPHHPDHEVGDPLFDIRSHLAQSEALTSGTPAKSVSTQSQILWQRLVSVVRGWLSSQD